MIDIGRNEIYMTRCRHPGVIRDFAGPYYVSEDSMAFGKPTKYWRLDLDKVPHGSSAWDKGVIEASNIYKKRMVNVSLRLTSLPACIQFIIAECRKIIQSSELLLSLQHNLCCDNCHSHVATALELMQYDNSSWNMVKLCFLMLFFGR